MTEQAVERVVMDALAAALAEAGVAGVRVFGAWQVADAGAAKGLETAADAGLLAVRVSPREYATATVPHATLSCRAALTMRSETDARGAVRLAAAEAVSGVLTLWQDDFGAFAAAFEGLEGARVCGFSLSGGDVGLDREAAAWVYEQDFTINCIIKKGTDA